MRACLSISAGGRRWNDAEPTLHPRQRGLEFEVFPRAILV